MDNVSTIPNPAISQGRSSARKAPQEELPCGFTSAVGPMRVAGIDDVVLCLKSNMPTGGRDIFERHGPTKTDILKFAGMRGDEALFIKPGAPMACMVEVDWRRNPVLVMGGKRLLIQSATPTMLTYSLR